MKSVRRRAVFIPGDGIGPEVTWAARRCAQAAGARITWEETRVGQETYERNADPLPPRAMRILLKGGAVLKGPLDGNYLGAGPNPNVRIKELLEVFATVQHCRSLPGVPSAWEGVDLIVIRQEEPERAGIEEVGPGHPVWPALVPYAAANPTAASVRFVYPQMARRFFEFAFTWAREAGRKKVTLVHRASVMKKTERAWVRVGEEVARRFPGLDFEDHLVDYVMLQLARQPWRFDIIVGNAEQGAMVGDLGVGLVGGLGVVPQANYGVKGAVFGTVHGTAPRHAGQDRANPLAQILALQEMLKYVQERAAAVRVERGVIRALTGGARVADICREGEKSMGTKAFVEEIMGAMRKGRLAGVRSR